MGKKAVKKSARAPKKAAEESQASGPANLDELRERVRKRVVEKIELMTTAAADEAAKGHGAQLQYLFEVIGLFPAAEAAKTEPQDSNDPARTLLAKLEFPHSLPPGRRRTKRGPGGGGDGFGRMRNSRVRCQVSSVGFGALRL